MNNNEIPQILAIFLAKFDPSIGPMIEYVVPKEKTPEIVEDLRNNSREKLLIDFKSITQLLLPNQVLYQKLIKIRSNDHYVMGYPVGVSGMGIYERNTLLFNLCFVFEGFAKLNVYDTVVRKVGQLFKELEINSGFIRNKKHLKSLVMITEKLMEDLNMFGESQLYIEVAQNQSLEFNFKLFPRPNIIAEKINSYDVPILVVKDFLGEEQARQDLSMDRVLKFINNVNHVKRIAQLSDVPIQKVVKILQHLQRDGCIKLTEIFQFCNRYVVTPKLYDLINNDVLQAQCLTTITHSNCADKPSMPFVVRLYSTLRPDTEILYWMLGLRQQVDWDNQIDIRKFINFGVVNEFVRQVRQYPVLINENAVKNTWDKKLLALLDGSHHLDEIAFELNTDIYTLVDLFNSRIDAVRMYQR